MESIANEIFRGLEDTGDGAFVVDSKLRIHLWNNAAEEILGFRKVDVKGQLCYQILQGSNEEGETICSEDCQISKLAMRSKPISNYDTRARTNQGEVCWLNMSIIILERENNKDKKMIVHLFRDISRKKNDELLFIQLLETASRLQKIPLEIGEDSNQQNAFERLTLRQKEVLTLLARGFSTREIVDNLTISQFTARNHIQQILQKLQVHSRVEAVAFALKNGLLDLMNDAELLQK